MKCHGCFKSMKDINKIKCSAPTCEKHFCCLCINLSGLSSENRGNWKCPDCCASQRKGGDNSSTPIRSTNENITLRKKSDTVCDAAATTTEVKELTSEVRLLTQEICSLKKQLESAISSLSSCEKRLDELGSAIATNDSRIKQLEDRKLETDILKATVKDLRLELNAQNQNHLRNELELSGVPETSNENIHHIALLAARKLGVELDDRDIDWVSRVGPRGKPTTATDGKTKFSRPVVVRLLRRAKRDEIIKAAKTRRNITSADIEIPGESHKIYYNERLTKPNRELFREARKKTKELGFSHCWCSQGTIFIRQYEGKPARSVRNQDDLADIFSISRTKS
ncbi:uncharacterized protein LOC120636863 [Pararge aegeria]|uniref:Jg7918 protein n=1 Tax=Pararge aegeria aegeria TaxID=348720 RepID=A0A8S4R760_9NEOP|nr:uncharacterized protein LOC120636863 [Pararge aegeria]CAH2230212.1 jg7918 [Pararge aegeria aegeria]